MLRRILMGVFMLMVIILFLIIAINTYNNNPQAIFKKVSKAINTGSITDRSNWLWQTGRQFEFEPLYMNVFSPGTARLYVKEESSFKGGPVLIIEAQIQLNDFFKKAYDAKMVINSTVDKNNKLSLRYQELSYTPEKNTSREIVYDPLMNIAERGDVKFKIPDNTYDPLAAFFNLMDSEFVIGKTIILNTISKEEVYELKVTPVEFKGNIYKLQGEVFRQDKSSTHGAKFTIWMSGGNIRVPLLIKVVSAAGPIYLRLKSVK